MSQELDLTNLRKVAEAATPGPWEMRNESPQMDGRNFTLRVHGKAGIRMSAHCYGFNGDPEFIATFDPPTVFALLSRLEQAEQAVARVRESWNEYKSKLGAQIPEHYRRNIDGALTGHWMTAGGTPTGELAEVCSCGKSYWTCDSLDGDTRG